MNALLEVKTPFRSMFDFMEGTDFSVAMAIGNHLFAYADSTVSDITRKQTTITFQDEFTVSTVIRKDYQRMAKSKPFYFEGDSKEEAFQQLLEFWNVDTDNMDIEIHFGEKMRDVLPYSPSKKYHIFLF